MRPEITIQKIVTQTEKIFQIDALAFSAPIVPFLSCYRVKEIRITYRAEYVEELRWHLFSESRRGNCKYANEKSEPPPSHIKGESATCDACDGEEEPHEAETPHDERSEPAYNVEDTARVCSCRA